MSESIGISAQTQSAEASLRRLAAEFNNLGREAARLSRQKFRLIDESDLGDIKEAEERLRQIMQMHPSIRTAVRASNQNPSAPSSVNWQSVPLTPGQIRTMMQHISGGENRFSRHDEADSHKLGESIARAFGRFFGGMGGGVGNIGGAAAGGAGGGLGGIMRGGLIGAGLYGAFKAGQAITEGYESAKVLATEMDTLKRRMGDVGVSFNALMNAAELSAHGLEVNSVEAGKLMSEFNRLSGGVKDSADLTAGTRSGIGLSKAFGIDANAGVGFLANIRAINRGGSADGDRKLALMIGDVVTRSGMNARADDVLQAVQQFAQATSRISLSSPNLSGFGGMYAGMLSSRIPGLTPENASALLGQANSAMMNMGAFGEASETFTLSALSNYGDLNPIQARVLAEGGLFGSRSQVFGKNSIYRRYAGDAAADALMGQNGDVTNFEAIRRQLDSMNVHPDIKAEMAKNYFGTSSISQAMALLAINPEEMGRTEKLLGSRDIDLSKYNATGIATLSKIANAGDLSSLNSIGSDLLGRTGKGALTTDESRALARAMKDAEADGTQAGMEKLRDTMADLAAGKDKQETLGSQMLDQQKRIETAMTSVGKELLGPIMTMKEALLVSVGMGAASVRDKAAQLERNDINNDINSRLKALDAEFSDDVANIPGERVMGAPVMNDEYKRRHAEILEKHNAKRAELEAERAQRIEGVNSTFEREKAAENDQRKAVGKASMSQTKQQFIDNHLAGAEAAGRELGVDPKLLLAQAGLETGWGRGIVPGTNNLGNIKAGKGWKGPTQRAYDKTEGSNDPYRVYASTDEYWKDYVSLIKRQYPGVVGSGSDARKFAHALKAGGYATDPRYENSIVNTAAGITLGSSTPLPMEDPLGKMMANSRQSDSIMFNGEFVLYDQNKTKVADPVNITKRVGAPYASGRN